VIFPGAEVADVARPAEAGGPGLIGFHDGVIQEFGPGQRRWPLHPRLRLTGNSTFLGSRSSFCKARFFALGADTIQEIETHLYLVKQIHVPAPKHRISI
jgi:hypothetical protein